MIEELGRTWSAEMTWDELALFCGRITEVRQELRRARGIRPPLTRCPRCGTRSRSELPGVSIRSALFALRNGDFITEEDFKDLDKSWRKHRAARALDACGRPKKDLTPAASHEGCCGSAQLDLSLQVPDPLPERPAEPPAAPAVRAPRKTGPIQARGPVGRKLIRRLRRERGKTVVDLSAIAEGARVARELHEGRVSAKDLGEYHPSHGWFVLAQQQLSIFVEQTGAMRETLCFIDPITDAEDTYVPVGPPMSPLTRSYFFYWSVCDLSPRGDGETLASATLDLVREIGTEPTLLEGMETLASSRMGLWEHRGLDGDRVILRELVTEIEHPCHVASGYRGKRGETWFARVLPPPPFHGLDAVVITTPYLLIRSSRVDWLAYLERALAPYSEDQREQVYPLLMKYGESPRYWSEFVFEGYANHENGVVFLAGFPDIEASRPHSRANS